MPDPHSDSPAFEALARELLNQGLSVRFEARGASMSPVIRDREIVIVTPVIVSKLRKGDIVLTKGHSGFRVHRLVFVDHHENSFITRGDCGQQDDPPVRSDQIFGVVLAKEVRLGNKIVQAKLKGIGGKLLQGAARGQRVAGRLLRKVGLLQGPRGGANTLLGALFLAVLFAATSFQAQVLVDTDPSTSNSADLVGPGTQTLTFTHSTTATANRVLIVGVSLNIANSPTAAVTGVTYNGTALALLGGHNDAANTRRVEQWSLLNPVSGTNLTINVSVNIPATATVGVTAGATVFTDVDQTVPLSSFVSADGAAAANSQLDVPSVINGMVFDTLAVGMGAVTVNGPQVQQWNVTSGGTTPNATQDVVGTASSRTGAPSVPISESFTETLALTSVMPDAIGLNLTSVVPTTITLTLTQAGNAAGGNTTYTGTITGGTGNAYVGDKVVIAGFTTGADNGTFTCTASTATTITVNNANGAFQFHAGTATVTTSTVYNGTITGGTGNAYAGKTVIVTGFTNAANNGTFTATASTATSLTLNNKASVAETDPGNAIVETGTSTVYNGTITGGINNGFAGDSFTIAGFNNAANNGTFTCTASTATTLTCSNAAGVAETRAGTATSSNTLNWSLGAVSVNPSAADIGVTTAVGTAVFLGQATTFTTTVFNNGTSPAVGISLSDTWPASMTGVTITPSAGTTCTAAPPPITCTLPTPFASGTTATVAVTATAPTAGAYTDTAKVTDTSPPDPNTGNNTYVAVATVQAVACAGVTQAAPGTNLTNVLNTYYPGTASVAAGATAIPVGTPTGAGAAIAKGNLLLVIQMQDASINDSNSVDYGNGYTGQGFTNLNSAGDYEFVTATGPIAAGSVPITGAGSGGGLVFAYHASVPSATAGQSTYQVIVVPQYTTASFSTTSPPIALAWNGSTGGVLAIDTSATLTLGGVTLSVSGMGFRGGAGMQLTGGTGANTDYWHTSPGTYTGAVGGAAGVDAPKGEGIAGTPEWVESGTTFLQTTTGVGYPSGTAGTDGSMARGAPGNAGGGGTDADPAANDQNAGGGGGSNGGAGGFGGDSWNTNLSVGGEGGTPFPATINRIAMGGGGGAGTRNNSDGDNQASGGATGGGIIIIRTYGLSGTATLTANGNNAYNLTANDAGGGGGGGGSIVVLSANGGESGLTLQANGGNGGNAWASEPYSIGNRHGPGGGGGGGVVLVSGTPASVSVSGGANGLTENPGVPYGATSGTAGFSVTNESITQTSGTQSGAQCTPDVTVTKGHVGNFTRGLTASYTVTASNISPYGPTSAIVTVNDTLPVGLTPTSATGAGWSCSVASQTVSCTDPSMLASSSSFITILANVLQTAPSTETNTALVSGGGEINLSNDSYTDIANVVSSADLSVTNVASPAPVTSGSNLTFTQVLTNNGPSAADNATLVQAVPANTTFVSVTAPTGWSCVTPLIGATGNVVCTALSMTGNTAATFSMVVKVNTGLANGTVITDTATASSSVSDPNSLNNTASASTVVGPSSTAEMTVTNVASPNPVVAGSDITYTQVATNVGTGTANNPSLVETVPANTTFVSLTVPGGTTCTPTLVVGSTGTTTCTAPAAPAGSVGTVIFVVQVNAGAAAGTVVTDTATANSTNQAFGANQAVATDVVASAASQADLSLSTAATPLTVYPGNDITYIQTVTNNGPATASSLTFTEAVPTNTTFASIAIPANWTCTTPAVGATGTISCVTASLATAASANIVVVVNLASTITVASITANSSIAATTSDPNSANNSTTTTTTVLPVCDLAVTNSVSPSFATDAQNLVYTQVVTNTGPSNCASATLTEAIPTNTTLVLPFNSPAGWTCTTTGSISCTNPTIAPGASSTFSVTVLVGASVASGTLITDTATLATTTHDSNLLNNSASVTVGVASATQADLSVTSSASPNPVAAGSNITYTQTATNAGPAAASTVTFSETLPANTTAQSLTGSAGWTCNFPPTLTCTIGSLAANSPANFTFIVTVNAGVASGSTITQTDSISSSVTGDPNNGNNSASTTVYVAPSADLSLTNTNTPVPVQAGGTITYAQVVKNNGPSTATGVSLTETTPGNTTFSSITTPAGWSCTTPTSGGTGTINCTNASFATGSSSFTIVLNVPTGTPAGTAINNTATVTSPTSDPNLANNTATATNVVATSTQANLVTTNSAAPTSVAPGSNVTYTQSVTNNGGPAAATTLTFSQTTPPNTNFQSITAPGWTCTTPNVGAAGTISCTASTLAVNATANFTLVLQVNAGTASGTNIAETDTATASNIVPNLTTNTATAIVTVANGNSANVTIAKSATPPNTVADGDTLTYTLTVTNNGPASATNVDVTDPLPSDVMWLQQTSSQGTCSQANGTVSCELGTVANGATATVTILTLAGAPGTATNTASVIDDQMTSPNTATQVETITAATSVKLQSFGAHIAKDKSGTDHVILVWKTGGEAHNLGFNVYREQNGERVQLNSSVIAGSALLMSNALPKHSGKTYSWIDSTPGAGSGEYWLEDVDTNSMRTLHGPVTASTASNSDDALPATSATLNHLSQAVSSNTGEQSHRAENTARIVPATLSQRQKQFQIAANPAVKIFVKHEGWYRVTQPDLINAGLDPNVDPAQLHLYTQAIEQPIQVTGATAGPGGFGPQAAISFYGRGIDTQYTGVRAYFLTAEETPGQRIQILPPSTGSNVPPTSFPYTVELTPHTTYFSALTTSNGNNFFGPLISSTPTDETITVSQLDATSTVSPQVEVILQGVILAVPHDVTVILNGSALGDVTFTGQDKGELKVSIPPGTLVDGPNTVTLTSQDGEYDYSLLQSIRITYPHLYVADSDELIFTGHAGDELLLYGFSQSAVGVFDITNPDQPIQLSVPVAQDPATKSTYTAEVQVPWSATNRATQHTLMAVAADRVASAADLRANHPSYWHEAQAGSDIVMVSSGAFAKVLGPIVQAHKAEGKSSAIVPVDELYDEFNFGEHSPQAIRDFLQTAVKSWRTTPKYLLLNGRASLDPRNYLGFGFLDFVPTKIIPTTGLVTASDGWFSDFNDTGLPTIATGRLPVSTAAEAQLVAGKIATYEGQSSNGSWTSQAMMVADLNDTENFTKDSQVVQAQLPAAMQVTDVFASTMGIPAAAQAIVTGINSGQVLVNYAGHGSEDMWSGSDLFDNNAANALTNGNSLPVFLIMDCLNGFFQDVYDEPLAVTLMLAPNGGAVAVLASSGLNQATPQTILDKLVVQAAMGTSQLTLGDAVVKAKSGISDVAVRKTYNLLGDPAMQIKPPVPMN